MQCNAAAATHLRSERWACPRGAPSQRPPPPTHTSPPTDRGSEHECRAAAVGAAAGRRPRTPSPPPSTPTRPMLTPLPGCEHAGAGTATRSSPAGWYAPGRLPWFGAGARSGRPAAGWAGRCLVRCGIARATFLGAGIAGNRRGRVGQQCRRSYSAQWLRACPQLGPDQGRRL